MRIAAKRGNKKIVELLIACRANIEATDNNTALYLSTRGGKFEILKYLISVGANPNGLNESGNNVMELLIQFNLQHPYNEKDKIQIVALLSHYEN